MPKRPTTHFVEFYDFEKVKAFEEAGGDFDLADIDELYTYKDLPDEKAARAFVAALEAIKPKPPWWRIWERYDIEDGTPAGERVRGLVWDYEERILVEAGEDEEG